MFSPYPGPLLGHTKNQFGSRSRLNQPPTILVSLTKFSAAKFDTAMPRAGLVLLFLLICPILAIRGAFRQTSGSLRDPQALVSRAQQILSRASENNADRNEVPRAYGLLRRALDLAPGRADIHNLAGIALTLLGRGPDALKEFEIAVKLEPANADYAFNLASYHRSRGEYEQVIRILEPALPLNPASVELADTLLWCYLKTSRYAAAQKVASDLIRLDPKRVRSHVLAGNLYIAVGDLERAKQHYSTAIELDPSNYLAHSGKGNVFLEEAQPEGAKREFQKALEIKPGYIESLVALGKIHLEENRLELARKYLLAALNSDPSYAETHFQLGTLYRKQGDLDAARRELELYERLRQKAAAK